MASIAPLSRLNSLPNEIKDLILCLCDPPAARQLSLVNKSFRQAVKDRGFETAANAECNRDSLVALEVILRLSSPPRAWTLAWTIHPARLKCLLSTLFSSNLFSDRDTFFPYSPPVLRRPPELFRAGALLLHCQGGRVSHRMNYFAAEAAKAGDLKCLEVYLASTTAISAVAYAAGEAAVESVPPQRHVIDWLCTSTLRTAQIQDAINSLLVHLCGKNDAQLAKQFIDEFQADPSADRNQAVFLASHFGHVSVVKLLLADSRVDPTARHNAALIVASHFGHASVVKLLLADSRVDPTAQRNEALVVASYFGHASVVKLLLADSRVDPTARYNKALRLACESGHTSVVELLLADSRVDPTAQQNTAICLACESGHTSVVELLLADSRVDPTAQRNEALVVASYFGHASVVKLLLADSRVDPTARYNTAICLACRNGHASVVKLLLADSRVDPTARNNSALRRACNGQHKETEAERAHVVAILLADGRVDPCANNCAFLQRACPRIALLLRADIRVRLHNACQVGSEPNVVALLQQVIRTRGGNLTGDDNFLIRTASGNGYRVVVELLLANHRVDPSARDNEAIRRASECGHSYVVELLLRDSRVDPSARDNEAIRRASQCGHSYVVKLLLADNRVDPSARGNEAFFMASGIDCDAVTQLLRADSRVDPTVDGIETVLDLARKDGNSRVLDLLS